jgi:hypothetical protein
LVPEKIIQGVWDELIARQDLRGHRVRVIVMDEDRVEDPWLKQFRQWADSHQAPGHKVDDSRDSIYSGSLDDPR